MVLMNSFHLSVVTSGSMTLDATSILRSLANAFLVMLFRAICSLTSWPSFG
ncbi:hypothetical protein [Pseudoglutamicibacter albus]|uniref:hypothetical protein n=1 Tax=Pseudoglutamicibacter albus TaxID=98671 RepID=UPI003616BB13